MLSHDLVFVLIEIEVIACLVGDVRTGLRLVLCRCDVGPEVWFGKSRTSSSLALLGVLCINVLRAPDGRKSSL